jgi:hypothetical protein
MDFQVAAVLSKPLAHPGYSDTEGDFLAVGIEMPF